MILPEPLQWIKKEKITAHFYNNYGLFGAANCQVYLFDLAYFKQIEHSFLIFGGFKPFETNVRPIPCDLNEGLHAIYRPQNWTNNFFHVDTPNLRQKFDDDAFRLPLIRTRTVIWIIE